MLLNFTSLKLSWVFQFKDLTFEVVAKKDTTRSILFLKCMSKFSLIQSWTTQMKVNLEYNLEGEPKGFVGRGKEKN